MSAHPSLVELALRSESRKARTADQFAGNRGYPLTAWFDTLSVPCRIMAT
jgi:hypothetical protein